MPSLGQHGSQMPGCQKQTWYQLSQHTPYASKLAQLRLTKYGVGSEACY